MRYAQGDDDQPEERTWSAAKRMMKDSTLPANGTVKFNTSAKLDTTQIEDVRGPENAYRRTQRKHSPKSYMEKKFRAGKMKGKLK